MSKKDPAFLFYPQDFVMGTMFFTNEQAGIYIRLLCSQHQQGGLIDKVCFNSMVGNNEVIRAKFEETEDGFFNVRMMKELKKRNEKSANMSANAHKRWDLHEQKKCNGNAKVMQPEDEDETEDKDRFLSKPLNTKPYAKNNNKDIYRRPVDTVDKSEKPTNRGRIVSKSSRVQSVVENAAKTMEV